MNIAKSRAVYLCAFLLVVLIFSQITLGAVKDSLKTTAEQEWERWGRGARQESEPQMKPIVAGYFAAGGCPGSDPTTVPWSAAFISYVVKTAGVVDFPGRCAHTQYFKAVHDNPGTCRTFPMSERERIGVGDVVCRCRVSEEERAAGKTECNVDYNNAFGYSHCDIVVNVLGSGKVEVIGGNVNNNVEKRTLDVSRDESPEKKWYGFISCDGSVSDITNVPISGSAQVQVGTVGVNPVGVYDGCSGKRIGLVGASNTWDTNPDGSSIPSSWRNVKIIQDLCPGSMVFLHANGGANPETQLSLVTQVLTNDNLDYVIIDPSANGQGDFSGWASGRYKAAAIKLAETVKQKDQNIKVIMLTNTPTKGAAEGYGTPEAILRIKTFNADLLNTKLGRPDLIDYVVDTYSAVEDPKGSDSCGKYCPNDHLHFGEAGRKQVMKAAMDTVFGAPAVATTVTSTTSSPSSGAENCLNKQRCDEIDAVWLKIVIWINNARKGQVFDTVKAWKPFQDTRPSTVITPPTSAKSSEVAIANKLYNDILAKLSNQNLAKAMVANAKGESGLNHMTAGDCGEYGEKNSGSSIPINGKGRCCSFGLWQYNICGGLGTTFLQSYGSPSSDQAKLAVVQDYQKNIDFMISHLQKTKPYSDEIQQQKTVDEWVAWFVKEIERPANPSGEIAKRQRFAQDLESAGAFSDSASLASGVSNVASGISNAVSSITSIFGGECPSEMANIDDKYCIDKWENSIYDKNNPSGKASLFYPAKTSQANSLYNYWRNGWKGTSPPNSAYAQMPERGAETTTGFAPLAVSQPNVIPNMFVSKEIAELACANAGKRLCTEGEWVQACKSPSSTSYPYGNSYTAGKCNTQGGYPPSVVGWTNVIPTNQFDPSDPRNGKAAVDIKGIRETGSFSECTNAYGVYDMVGNLDEAVSPSSSSALFKGSAFMRKNDANCDASNSAHGSTYTDYSFGFRCCATLS